MSSSKNKIDGPFPELYMCPHCNEPVFISKKEINCGIFRHAVFKDTFKSINPHAKKEECIKLLELGKIYGCAGPFRLVNGKAVICDYI